ncbi:hypothetical protein HYH02_009484 [Chlamydomonas schloesseri]|uniref:F-box domain-containing protein n=1 Tax=Chlamydomonas schloesseri TaxID=2026947 RepID=A0A835TPU9_9CHLO|nr:hypothetical protein HYH02_009484 [Chlamydomonas schloesseri]|eukprot:KAG2443070.1 hypothetical protein HYH02_009484 [Chlamydomonas schloesseri]
MQGGPTFEVALRSCPPAKLVYGHVPTANVNAAASRIAGHAVKGDACLLLSPTGAMAGTGGTSGGASSSSRQLLQLPPPDLLLDALLGGTRLAQQLLANPRQQGPSSPPATPPPQSPAPHQQPNTAAPASAAAAAPAVASPGRKQARCPQAAISAILQGRNALASVGAAAASMSGSSGSSSQWTGGAGGGAGASAAPSVSAALGRAPSWEPPLAPPCKSARNSLESPPHPPHHQHHQLHPPPHRPAHAPHSLVSALAAAVASGDGIARPASPGVSCLARQLAAGSLLGGGGGSSPAHGGHGALSQEAAATASGGSYPQPHKRRHSVDSVEASDACMSPSDAATAATAAAAVAVQAACMELDAAGPVAAVCCEPAGPEASPVAVAAKARRSLQEAAVLQGPGLGAKAAQQQQQEQVEAAPAEQQQAGLEVDVPWQELPCDVVAYVATQLPQQASQAVAMSGVCRGWRVALLGNLPALRRITFNLDPTNHLRGSSSSSSKPTSITPTTGSSGGGGVGAVACAVGLRRRSAARDAAAASADATGRGEEEQAAMAVALSRQYGVGSFVLPCAHTAAGGLEGMEEHTQEPEPEAKEPVVPRAAARRPPALLLEAARGASNPSAQLVMAQLLEGSGDADGSLRWWRKLAIAGDVMGVFKLGMACYDGSHGMQSDPEAAHMWLSRAVRHILQVDSLSAIQLDEQHGSGGGAGSGGGGAGGGAPAGAVGAAGGTGAGGAGGQPRVSLRMRRKLAALDPTLLRMLGWSSIVLGYLEFDGVAGRSVWGMGDRSEAVRLFRLAEGCGCNEAAAVLGWLYNTGQY